MHKNDTHTTQLTHLDHQGAAHMVDVSAKPVTIRRAVAEAVVGMQSATLQLVLAGQLKKGDVFATARIAGIQAAKRCAELIPLCHPIPLTAIDIQFAPDTGAALLKIRVTCQSLSQTGVEMEALTAASIAALTVYDMAKSVEKGMVIGPVRLLEKTGGKSDYALQGT